MPRKKNPPGRYDRNLELLRRLGAHCQQLRIQKGYSMDRMSKEAERLSASVIHRLENGSGAVTVSSLFKYAEILGVSPGELFRFDYHHLPASSSPTPQRLHIVPNESPRISKEAFQSLLPLYSLKAAAGYFGRSDSVQPLGWVKCPGKLDPHMFVIQAVGDSMTPKIQNGDYLIMRADPQGSRQNKIVLAEYKGPADPDTGGSYTVKKYVSSKIANPEGGWQHSEIRLEPINPSYESILIPSEHASDFRIVAECVGILDPS